LRIKTAHIYVNYLSN